MSANDTKSSFESEPNGESSLFEVKKLHNQLEEERKSAAKKEALMTKSLQESKQMSTHLQQITQALTKERKAVIEKSEKERLLWRLIERINSSFDLEHILQATVDELGHYFKVNRCGIIIPRFRGNKDLVKEFAPGEWKRSPEVYSNVSLSILYTTVVKTLKPLIINDTITNDLTAGHLNEELRSILMVPLLQKDQLVGVVYLHQCRAQRNWGDHELSLLQAASGPIATAVEKTRLFNRTKSWAAREKLFNKLTSRIRGTLNITAILERTAEELGQALQVSRCFINIIDPKTSREKICSEYNAPNITAFGINSESPLIINKLSEKKSDFIAVNDVFKEVRLAKLSNKEVEQLYKTGARALLAVPISFQTKLFGWLCFHQCNLPRNWTTEEISFVQSVASQVGVAINQAEMVEQLTEYQTRISRELKQAAQLQSILLSPGSDLNKNLSMAVSYHPHHNVSGDFYWINELAPHIVSILIGDVSGKGSAAALLTGYIIGEIKGLLQNQETAWDPELFFTELSNSIYEQNQYSDFYATAWYGIFDLVRGKVLCSNAGHPSPYLIANNTANKVNDEPGVPLGLLSTKDFAEGFKTKEFKLNPGERMVIFTDGLIEQRQLDGSFVPETWLKEALKKLAQYNIKDMPEALIKILNIVSKGVPADDDRLVVGLEMSESKKTSFESNDQNEISSKIKLIIEDAINNGMPKSLEASLKLGLIEAVYNAFRHGASTTPKGKKQSVELYWWLRENAFSCSIIDSGIGFNWKEITKNKSRMKDIDVLDEGGRGLPLLFEIFTKVSWNPAGNEIGLVLNW